MNKKALAILRKCYIPYKFKAPTESEWELGISDGVLVPEKTVSHDMMIAEIKWISSKLKIEKCAKAFLYSLSTGDLRYRTAISSFIWANSLPEHEFCKIDDIYDASGICTVCGCSSNFVTESEIDLNQYNVFRFLSPVKYGNEPDFGCLEYVYNDLSEFAKLPDVEPKAEDYDILNSIFACVNSIKSHNKAVALIREIKNRSIIGETANSIHCLLGVLSMCGILETDECRGYLHKFTDHSNRDLIMDSELFYPLNFWVAKFGVNYEAVNTIFGSFSGDKLSPEKAVISDKCVSVSVPKKKKTSSAEKYFPDEKCIVELTNEERRYLALEPMKPEYEVVTFHSTTYNWHKRTKLFFDGNTIMKVIYEEIWVADDGTVKSQYFTEYDTHLETDGRTMLRPLTAKGSPKKITPTNVMAIEAFGCTFTLTIKDNDSSIGCGNYRNAQYLNTGEHDCIKKIKSENDFHEFMKWYITTCPDNYFDMIHEIKTAKHVTVKFSAGDIFRCQYDRTHFCYGLVLGKTREIEKWKELPDEHSFRHLMTQPIMIRMYDFVTVDPDMTPEQLADKPLRPLEICSDCDLIWGTHKIVGHKRLVPEDIQFDFILCATGVPDKHIPPLSSANDLRQKAQFYVEWGFVQFYMELGNVPEEIRNIPPFHHGVSMGIGCSYCGMSLSEILAEYPKHILRDNLNFPENRDKYRAVMQFFGLPVDAGYDDFARKFGGMTRHEFIDKVQGI